jgi:LPPG:FO 2-phospho-L-lactate transferase
VALRCAPKVQRVHCARSAAPTPEVLDAIRNADIIVIAPSNPLLSIEPMLALPGLRESLENRRVPCVAVSPLIGGRAVKGPLDKMLADLNLRGGNAGLADRYARLIDGMVIDRSDACDVDGLHDRGLAVLTAPTLIRERGPAHYLAARVLDWAERLRLGVVAGVQP